MRRPIVSVSLRLLPLAAVTFLVFSVFALSGRAQAATDPTAVGPYGIGHEMIPAATVGPLGGYSTNVSVWYPTTATSGAPADYTTGFPPGVDYTLPSPLGAIENAPVAASTAQGFPLLITAHGSGGINRDTGRLIEMPINEFLASHGFVVVGYTYPQNGFTAIRETLDLIDYMIGQSPVAASIDPNKVGILGFSAGGITFGVASGTFQTPRDPRVKAIVGYEAVDFMKNTYGFGMVDKNVTAAAMVMHDGYLPVGSFNGIAGRPVIDVYTKRFTHDSFGTGACLTLKVNRELAIANGVAEPLVNPGSDPYAVRAWNLWHAGDPSINQEAGGASDYCDVSGWSPPVSPDLLTGNGRYTQEAETTRRLRLYTLSFLKTHLAGESGYSAFLSKAYAQSNFASDDLTVEVRK